MGMETLNSAARAAGFAMAASDEPYETPATVKVEAQGWRPSEAMMLTPAVARPSHAGAWFRGVLGLFGRRAPASPA